MPDDNATDRSLMARVQGGDTDALGTLIKRWERRVLVFIYRYVGDAESARDLTQESFVRVYQSRERFDLERTFSTWMFGIATNLCRNHQRWRRRHAEAPLEDAGALLSARELAPDLAALRADSIAIVAAAVGRLPHASRVCLLLHYYEDLSYREISEVVGCSPRGVESRLYRARKALAHDLRQKRDPPAKGSLKHSCA